MFLARCPWYIAGPLIGLLMIGLRAAANKPFGALGGFIDIAENALSPRRLGFRAWMLIGLAAGGVLFALLSGTFVPTIDYGTAGGLLPDNTALQFGLLVFAGLIMGIGTRTAGGCTSGHGMSGMCVGSPASIVSTITFFATAVGLANLYAWLWGTS